MGIFLILGQVHSQTPEIILKFDGPLLRVCLELFRLGDFPGRFDLDMVDSNKEGFSVLVDDELGPDELDDALVILFDELDELLDDAEELFVEECVEELVPFEVLGLCNLKLLRGTDISKLVLIQVHGGHGSEFTSLEGDDFVALAFDDMVFPETDHFVALIDAGFVVDLFPDDFPLVVKGVFVVLVLSN